MLDMKIISQPFQTLISVIKQIFLLIYVTDNWVIQILTSKFLSIQMMERN